MERDVCLGIWQHFIWRLETRPDSSLEEEMQAATVAVKTGKGNKRVMEKEQQSWTVPLETGSDHCFPGSCRCLVPAAGSQGLPAPSLWGKLVVG